jgi:hypothetical protein
VAEVRERCKEDPSICHFGEDLGDLMGKEGDFLLDKG